MENVKRPPGTEIEPGVTVYGDTSPVPAAGFGADTPVLEVGEIEVTNWSPQAADDPAWKATQIHVIQHVPVGVIVTRLKSEAAARRYIEALVRSYRKVFGNHPF